MPNTLAPIAWWPQTKNDFGIISAATSVLQDTLTRGRNATKNVVTGTKNTIFNLFK